MSKHFPLLEYSPRWGHQIGYRQPTGYFKSLFKVETPEQANYLVTAVNSHDQLVAALKYIHEMVSQGALPNHDDSWFEETKQALANATQPNEG